MKEEANNSDTKWMGAGLLAAFVASLCCVTPVIAFIVGIGGVASTFSWVEPFRPYLIGLTALLLGFAWYQKLKPENDIECACDEDPSFWQTEGFLGIVTVLAALLLAFPYYSDTFFPKQDQKVVYVQENQVQTITLDIQGMTCTGCEASVKHAAGKLEGVIEAKASYDTETATIKFDQSKVKQSDIEAAINKTGFTVAGSQQGKKSSGHISSFYDSKDICPLHGEGNCSGSCQARSTCTVEHLDQTLAETLDKEISVDVVKLDENNTALKNAFNEHINHPRFVAILSSVCRWCINGAKKIKQSLIDQTGTENFRLYIIWIDMLEDDNYASAQKAAKLLYDPRVTHYYTSGKKLSREVTSQISGKEGVAWDIYMFYDGSVLWGNSFPKPGEYIHQLNPDYYSWVESDKYFSGEQLKQRLFDLTSTYKKTSNDRY